jgi:hypothetical protein
MKTTFISVIHPDGRELKVQCDTYKRSGTLAPELSIFIFEGKRITPYEQKKRGWSWTFAGVLQNYLNLDLLKEELVKRDSFLKGIKKDSTWVGAALVVPF